jgi:hypothetical protein
MSLLRLTYGLRVSVWIRDVIVCLWLVLIMDWESKFGSGFMVLVRPKYGIRFNVWNRDLCV